MDLVIRRLQIRDEAAFAEATAAWDEAPAFRWSRPEPGETFAAWLRRLQNEEAGVDLPPGRVPSTILCGFVGEKLVARASVRHRLNPFLAQVGGHVGYGVLPAWRRQGIATRMLQAALDELRRRDVPRALVTCDESNEGSRRTIEKCGGLFESLHRSDDGSEPKRRYWIELDGRRREGLDTGR